MCEEFQDGEEVMKWTEAIFGMCIYTERQKVSFVLGLIAVGCSMVSQFPQILLTCCRRSSEGVSFWFLFLYLIGDTINLFAMLLTGGIFTQIVQGFYFVSCDCVLMSVFLIFGPFKKSIFMPVCRTLFKLVFRRKNSKIKENFLQETGGSSSNLLPDTQNNIGDEQDISEEDSTIKRRLLKGQNNNSFEIGEIEIESSLLNNSNTSNNSSFSETHDNSSSSNFQKAGKIEEIDTAKVASEDTYEDKENLDSPIAQWKSKYSIPDIVSSPLTSKSELFDPDTFGRLEFPNSKQIILKSAFSVLLILGTLYFSNSVSISKPQPQNSHFSRKLLWNLARNGTAHDNHDPLDTLPEQAGFFLGFFAAAFDISSNFPQLVKNCTRRSTDGLSIFLFLFLVSGQLFYVCSLFMYSFDSNYLVKEAPFYLGSGISAFLGIIIMLQHCLFTYFVPVCCQDSKFWKSRIQEQEDQEEQEEQNFEDEINQIINKNRTEELEETKTTNNTQLAELQELEDQTMSGFDNYLPKHKYSNFEIDAPEDRIVNSLSEVIASPEKIFKKIPELGNYNIPEIKSGPVLQVQTLVISPKASP